MLLALTTLLGWSLLAVQACLVAPIFYLCILALSAIIATQQRKANKPGKEQDMEQWSFQKQLNFAILIPAHNEEALLGKLLDNLRQLRYPQDHYTVYVVADNCTDRTAAIARLYREFQVFERFNAEKRGKGYALNWLMQQLKQEQRIHDAYVILDADSVVVPNFLDAMAKELHLGARALQAHNTVLNTTESPGTVLRWVALTLMNHIRPLGRNGIGASSTITGNGICLSRELLERYPWESYALSEDYQYYLTLVLNGEKVRYVPEAIVRSHMPATFSQMRTQDIRWEAQETTGTTWQTTWSLLLSGIEHRDFVRIEAVAELLTPPLSSLIGGSLLTLLGALLLHFPSAILLGSLLIAGLVAYVTTAFYLLHPPRAAYRALLYAPAFIVWKLWVALVLSRSKKHTSEWIRTSRPNSTN